MAEKESGGNALKRASDPNSSASGLFQITRATARDWGLSPEDRFDAVKSATAAADVLAQRASKVGPERAVGMHYGGPGAAWETPVGSSGLSPASYSADVFARARKYAGPPSETVAFPPPGFTDQGTAPPPPDHYDTRFLVKAPDGSTSTQVLRTDRPLSQQELANHVAGQGGTFVGYPEAPPPPPPQAAPSPAPGPSLGARAKQVLLPERSFASQLPSIGGATLGGYGGAAVGAATGPFAPIAVPFFSTVGAGAGSALGEAGELGYEYLTGAQPAEAGSAWDRMTNAALRGAATEGLIGQPLRWGAGVVSRAVMPAARAAESLAPVLESTAAPTQQVLVKAADGTTRTITSLLENPADIPAFVKGAPEAQQALLNGWWQRTAPQGTGEVIASWNGLPRTVQTALAGGQREAVQTVVDTLGASGRPLTWGQNLATGGGLAAGAGWLGHPQAAAYLAGAPTAINLAGQIAPKVESAMLMSPAGSQWLARLPAAMSVASPTSSFLLRTGSQAATAAPGFWPAASQITPGG